MPRPSPGARAAFCILATAVGVIACHSATTAPDTLLTELLGARVPATATPDAPLEVAGYFGRGACDVTRPVVERSGATVRIALVREPIEATGYCIGILLRDSVVARIAPPVPLPLTVRLRRAGAPDSVVVVRMERTG